MFSNSIAINKEQESELLQAQAFLENLRNNPDQVINSVIKKKYLDLLNLAFEKAKTDSDWAKYFIPELLKFGILGKEDKEKYLELLNLAFEKAKTDSDWARSVIPELLKLGILEKEDKEKYLELLNLAFEMAKTDKYWAQYVIPELLKLGILEKEELQKALLTKEQAYNVFEIIFLEKHSQKLSAEDLIQF